MIYHHKRNLPIFGVPGSHMTSLHTVLSVNPQVGDCAAYEGIAHPDHSPEDIRAHGNKIREAEARKLFPEIEEQGLRYRK